MFLAIGYLAYLAHALFNTVRSAHVIEMIQRVHERSYTVCRAVRNSQHTQSTAEQFAQRSQGLLKYISVHQRHQMHALSTMRTRNATGSCALLANTSAWVCLVLCLWSAIAHGEATRCA